jgi:ComF family protein
MLFTRLLQKVPSQCAVCRGWGTQAICAACTERFAAPVPRCERCALQVPNDMRFCGTCLTDPPSFDGALAAVDYAHPWSTLITQFKFHAALDLAQAFSTRLHAAWLHAHTPAPDLLLPVPLSTQRLRERGYNQAWELARRVASLGSMKADARLLLRVKDTPHQLALPPDQRAANVRAAFVVEPLRRAELSGRSVAVIDDVMTTGATFGEIARVLKQAGASRVEAWALARTPRPGSSP